MSVDINLQRINKVSYIDNQIIKYMDYDESYPEWVKSYVVELKDEEFDYEKFYEEHKDFNIDNYLYDGMVFSESDGVCIRYIHKNTQELLIVNTNDIPRRSITRKVFAYQNESYLRNIFNKKFYDDLKEGRTKDILWTYKEVEEYMNNYCNEQKNSYGKYEYPKIDFKNYILDEFVEGETFVTIS